MVSSSAETPPQPVLIADARAVDTATRTLGDGALKLAFLTDCLRE